MRCGAVYVRHYVRLKGFMLRGVGDKFQHDTK